MKNSKNRILSAIKHLLMIGVLALAFWPFARDYLFASAPAGCDYYTGLIYAEFFRKYLTWPPAGWENFWYSGIAVSKGYPWVHFYLMQPLVRLFGSGWGMEIYSVVALFLFFVFAYLLFWELSKNRLFSLLLSLILFNSRGVLNALPWNGFITASATQMFLPLVAYAIIRFYRSRNNRWLLVAGLLSGLAILLHPAFGLILIFAPAILILFFWRDEKIKFLSIKKIKFCLIFGLIAILVSSMVLFQYGDYFLNRVSGGKCEGLACSGDIPRLIGDLNPLFYILTAILLGTALFLGFSKKRFNFWMALTFFIPLSYLIAFLAGEKLHILESISTLMWPERITWAVGLILGAISAAFFGDIFQKMRRSFQISIRMILSGAILFLLIFLLVGQPIQLSDRRWLGPLVLDFSTFLSPFSMVGAYPEGTPLYVVDKYKKEDVATILPSWLKKDDFNYRFDSLKYEVNYWWNLGTEVPNTRGYVNLMRRNQSYWYGWLMSGLMDWWGEGVKRPKEVSQNTTRFLVDWYAIRYLEGTYMVKKDRPYSDFLLQGSISDKKEQIGRLTFQRIAENQTSPIVKASKAPSMFVVGKKDTFIYDNLMGVLAAENLNSQVLIPIRGSGTLDELKKYDLNDFDVIFLNDYRYEEFSSWDLLTEYVENGGRLIIETGTQVRESDSATLPEGITRLPEVFPTVATKRESLGIEWQLSAADHSVLEGVDIGDFGPLLYEEAPWKLSYVPNKDNLKKGAKVLLSQKDYPILVAWELGKGRVIWSGLNSLYHFKSYDKPTEAKLFANMLSFLLDGFSSGETDFSLERKRPERVKIMGSDFSGVVFKEHFDSGWQAKVNGKKVRIYPAGPDFMYVRVPKDLKGELKVEFYYRGSFPAWFFFFLSLGTIILTTFYSVTGKGLGFGFLNPTKKKLNGWWSREED